jgi:predicted thioesterase
MIAFMETISHRLLAKFLPEGYSSVGVSVNARHLAPTPLGQTVRVRSEVVEVNGVRVTFAVQAWDEMEQVGEGQHQRVAIDEARFLRRVAAKSQEEKP